MTANHTISMNIQIKHGLCTAYLHPLTLKRLLHIDGLLRTRLKIRYTTLTLTKRLRPLTADHPLALIHIHLIPQHNERERLGIHRTSLDQEFVPPAVQRVERFAVVDIVDEDAAVGAAVEGYA